MRRSPRETRSRDESRRACARSAASTMRSPRRYDSRGRARADEIGLVSACDMKPPRSASEYTATVPIPSSRSVRKIRTAISPRLATRTLENSVTGRVFSPTVTLPDQLTVARVAAVPIVVLLFAWDFPNHAYWATAVFVVAMATDQIDGWLARRRGISSPLGKLLDPVADKVLVLAALVMLIGEGVAPAWMVALIVVREILVSGLRLAAIERGIVLGARDLGRVKTWAQAASRHDRGACGRWSMERRRGLVGAFRRARGDVGLRPRLRARRASGAARRERVGRAGGQSRDRLARGCASPCARRTRPGADRAGFPPARARPESPIARPRPASAALRVPPHADAMPRKADARRSP